MERILLIPIFLISFFCIVNGQNIDSKNKKVEISIGPQINYNFGTIKLGAGKNKQIRGLNLSNFYAFGGGLSANFKFKNGVFLQTGIVYDTRTVRDPEFVSVSSKPYSSSFKLKVNYLNIPLIAGYILGKGNIQPYFSGGLQLGQGLKGEVSNIYDEELPTWVPKNEPFFEFDKVEYGFLFEMGIRQKIGQSNLLNFYLLYMGGDRGTFVSPTRSSKGGAINLGTKKVSFNLAFLFKL